MMSLQGIITLIKDLWDVITIQSTFETTRLVWLLAILHATEVTQIWLYIRCVYIKTQL